MGRNNGADGWCILRCSAARTLALAASLAGAGFEVWTPTETQRRMGRGKQRKVEELRPAPITPTFVFARAAHLSDLIGVRSLPMSPHPAFSILRRADYGNAIVSDAGLRSLRVEEDRRRVRHLKTTRRTIEPGSTFAPTEGAFAGMTGIVERCKGKNGKEAVVNFGRGLVVSIATYLLDSEVIQSGNRPLVAEPA